MARFTRRQLLQTLAAIPATFAVGAGGLWWRWWDAPHGAELLVLADDEFEFLQSIAEAWMPPGGRPAISGSEARVGSVIDGMLSKAPDKERSLLKLLFQALDDVTVLSHGSAFRHLDLETRITILKEWRESSLLRQAVEALLILIGEAYATHPDVRAEWRSLVACGR